MKVEFERTSFHPYYKMPTEAGVSDTVVIELTAAEVADYEVTMDKFIQLMYKLDSRVNT